MNRYAISPLPALFKPMFEDYETLRGYLLYMQVHIPKLCSIDYKCNMRIFPTHKAALDSRFTVAAATTKNLHVHFSVY